MSRLLTLMRSLIRLLGIPLFPHCDSDDDDDDDELRGLQSREGPVEERRSVEALGCLEALRIRSASGCRCVVVFPGITIRYPWYLPNLR
jgi:hypothetical protein